MITYERRSLWKLGWITAVAVGLLGGWVVWSDANRAQTRVSGTPQSAAWHAADGRASTAVASDQAWMEAPTLADDGRPSDFKPDEWAALKKAMAKSDHPAAETQRVVQYLRFQRGFEQWRGLQDSPDVERRHALARRLADQVPDRLRQREMTVSEALMLESALLNDLEPNPQAREQRLIQAQAMLLAAAPAGDHASQPSESALQAEYKRREAAIVADWQAKSPVERNQAQLEDALEAARRAVYAGNK